MKKYFNFSLMLLLVIYVFCPRMGANYGSGQGRCH